MVLNVSKTKEIIFDPRSIGNHNLVTINEEPVEQVATYKYLGVILRRLRVFGIMRAFFIGLPLNPLSDMAS